MTPTRTQALLTDPPLPLLLRLTAPNTLAFIIQAAVALTEVWIVGQLGTNALAAMALVFPLLMLFQTVSGGAFGGAVGSAIARSLGNGDMDRAERLAWHAMYVAIGGAAAFLFLFVVFGRPFLVFLGGQGDVLAMAMSYCWILFCGGFNLWFLGVMSAVFRGAGVMTVPAYVMSTGALLQVPLTGGLVLGWFGLPALGMPGAAVSVLVISSLSSLIFAYLLLIWAPVRLKLRQCSWRAELLEEILKVARPATLNPVMTVSTVLGLTALVGQYGPSALAGYGIGARIEYVLLPVIFAFGTALTTIVGTNIGAGQIARAEASGMYGVACAAGLSAFVGISLALLPEYWIPLFTDDAAAFAAAKTYIQIVGPAYPFLGAGLVLYFASQGAGKMFWPVSAMVFRFVLSLSLASLAVFYFHYSVASVFWCAALGMVLYATIIVTAVRRGAWRQAA